MGIRPVFRLLNGILWIKGFKKNVRESSAALFEEFAKATDKVRRSGKKIIVTITHADDGAEAEKLKQMVESLANVEVAFINLLSAPAGGHTGPGSMAICWNQ